MDSTVWYILATLATSTVITAIVNHLLSKRTREITEAQILVSEYRQFIAPLKQEIQDLRDEVGKLRSELGEAVAYIRENGHDWPTPPKEWLGHYHQD